MSEISEFKKPTIDLKILAKGKKVDLPGATFIEDNIIPNDEENAEKAEIEKTKEIPPVPYKEPIWSGKCNAKNVYSFEVLKGGVILEKIEDLQLRPFWVFGRLPNCNINLAHPTISRYHLILQYCPQVEEDESDEEIEKEGVEKTKAKYPESGWYIYDLDSTHGTFLNKTRLKPKVYTRVKVGHMLKLGSSSRTFIFNGPTEDEEEPSPFTITEIKDQRNQKEAIEEEIREMERLEKEKQDKLKAEEGISWGMGEDADEETDLQHNPYAMTNNEELFLVDPKKTLRGYFEREGYDLDYKLDELSAGSYVCKVELPIEDAMGRPIVAEVTHKGKKKDCVVQCALEACRILDRQSLLRQATHEPRRRHKKDSDEEDDDEFWDRTGDVEKKRQKKLTKTQNVSHNYEDFIKQEAELLERMENIEKKIQDYQIFGREEKKHKNDDEDLEEFMQHLKQDKPVDKVEIRKLRIEQQQLKNDHIQLQKLIKIAKPLDLPSIKMASSSETSEVVQKKKALPLFGKRNKVSSLFGQPKKQVPETISKNHNEDIFVPEDDIEEKEIPSESSKILGPVLVPEAIEIITKSVEQQAEKYEEKDLKRKSDGEENSLSSSKKKRNRVRNREKYRENVDFDEELEDEGKKVEWIPPSNQKGDGFTSLNEKFGY